MHTNNPKAKAFSPCPVCHDSGYVHIGDIVRFGPGSAYTTRYATVCQFCTYCRPLSYGSSGGGLDAARIAFRDLDVGACVEEAFRTAAPEHR